ncbi:MAG: hypothetical protein O7E53_01750 [Alphaproteobacteria bacterium]|nr:hypothetical protein [Alphaproteobacteria bacterium]
MAVLVVAEHSNEALAPASLSTITAAGELGGDVTVLVAGHGCRKAAEAAAAIDGVAKVVAVDAEIYACPSAENLTALIQPMAGSVIASKARPMAMATAIMPKGASMTSL